MIIISHQIRKNFGMMRSILPAKDVIVADNILLKHELILGRPVN